MSLTRTTTIALQSGFPVSGKALPSHLIHPSHLTQNHLTYTSPPMLLLYCSGMFIIHMLWDNKATPSHGILGLCLQNFYAVFSFLISHPYSKIKVLLQQLPNEWVWWGGSLWYSYLMFFTNYKVIHFLFIWNIFLHDTDTVLQVKQNSFKRSSQSSRVDKL